MEKEEVKVSVIMLAYNIGRYVETAIKGVLSQQTKYRVQLVIGEDCSTDNTLEYANVMPNNIPRPLHWFIIIRITACSAIRWIATNIARDNTSLFATVTIIGRININCKR